MNQYKYFKIIIYFFIFLSISLTYIFFSTHFILLACITLLILHLKTIFYGRVAVKYMTDKTEFSLYGSSCAVK